jgi:hypothetical protein
MLENDRRKIRLQQIIDDPASTDQERSEATCALCELNSDQPAPSLPGRHGRNANVPQTQADQDVDIESWYQRVLLDSNLTSSDRRDIFQGCDSSTQAIVEAFTNHLLWLFGNNDAEIHLLIDLHRRTQSDFVRSRVISTIRDIATYSTVPAAREQASEFLNQLDSTSQQPLRKD